MGQYFRIVNITKKEWIEPKLWKIWEICANNDIRMLGYLLATDNQDGTGMSEPKKVKYFGRWCADKIAIVGDYADDADNTTDDMPAWDELKESREWKDITSEVVKEFNEFIKVESMKVG